MPFTFVSYARAKSPVPGRSILITRAPRSASWRVAKGAATACSSETTVMPARGATRAASYRRTHKRRPIDWPPPCLHLLGRLGTSFRRTKSGCGHAEHDMKPAGDTAGSVPEEKPVGEGGTG